MVKQDWELGVFLNRDPTHQTCLLTNAHKAGHKTERMASKPQGYHSPKAEQDETMSMDCVSAHTVPPFMTRQFLLLWQNVRIMSGFGLNCFYFWLPLNCVTVPGCSNGKMTASMYMKRVVDLPPDVLFRVCINISESPYLDSLNALFWVVRFKHVGSAGWNTTQKGASFGSAPHDW